jgi:hypothetical protein
LANDKCQGHCSTHPAATPKTESFG